MAAQTQPRLARESGRALPRKIHFTRASLAAVTCPAGKTEVIVYDLKVPGLMYRVKPTGRRVFYWSGRVRGEHRPVKHLLGSGELPIEVARTRATETAIAARAGQNPNAATREKRKASKGRATFESLWQNYRDGYLNVRAKEKTRTTHASVYHTWLAPLGPRAADSIDGDQVEALHAAIGKGRVREKRADGGRGHGRQKLGGHRTANKAVALLRRIYNYNKLPSPMKPGVVELFKENARERFLAPNELKRFFAALAEEQDIVGRDFLELAIFTGMRSSNVKSMEWSEISFDEGTWTIPATKAKADKPIVVALVPPALAILKRRHTENVKSKEPSRYVLNRGKGHIVEAKYVKRRVCKAADIANLTIHDLRRTLGSWQAAGGTSLPIIGKSLGHRSLAATAIYARLDLDPVRESVTRAAAAMEKAAGRRPTKGGTTKKPK